MARSSTVKMDTEFRWWWAKVRFPIENVKPVWLPILEPSVKQRITPRKVDKISRKRERYTMAFVQLLGKLHSLSTMVGGGIAHVGIVGNMGGGQ